MLRCKPSSQIAPNRNPMGVLHLRFSPLRRRYVFVTLSPHAAAGIFGQYFGILPLHADLAEWDQVVLGADSFFVQEVYIDSGYKFCRAIRRADPRHDFVYHHRGAGMSYDPATRVVTSGLVDYNVTGFAVQDDLGKTDFVDVKMADVQIVVKQDHIGVTPNTESEVTWLGTRYKIKKVGQDFLMGQYKLWCVL